MSTILAVLVLATLAPQAQEDPYKTLALGDRVRITFLSGNTVTGSLVSPPTASPEAKVSSIDYTQATSLTLDMSWEYPGLNGTLTVQKHGIKSIEELQKLDAATRKRLEEERANLARELEAQNEERRAAEQKRVQDAMAAAERMSKELEASKGAASEGDRITKQAEELKRGLALLAKFPPEQWNTERIKEIQNKAQLRQFPTTEEREFLEGYDLWLQARRYMEERKGTGKAEEAAPTAPKTAEK